MELEPAKNSNNKEVDDCEDLIAALDCLYKATQKLVFYFVPKDILDEVLEACRKAEQTLKERRGKKD